MTTPNLPTSQWPVMTVPVPNVNVLALNPNDTVTPPAGPGGSNWLIPLSTLSGPRVWPSGDPTGVKDTANIIAAMPRVPSNGGKITLASTGQWYINCGQITFNRSGAYIDGEEGFINVLGSGDMVRMYDSSTYSGRLPDGGGIIGNPVIDGTSTTGPSCPFHAGDIPRLSAVYRARKFLQPSSPAVWWDNVHNWTEQIQGRVSFLACTGGVLFDHSNGLAGSTGSFERMNFETLLDNTGIGDGVTFKGGAFTLNHSLAIRGNFSTSAPGTGPYAVLRLTGSDSSGQQSTILSGKLDIGVELGDLTAGNVIPQTIAFGGPGNLIWNTMGVIDFSANKAFASSNNVGQFRHSGPVLGDAKLMSSEPATAPISQAITGSNQTIFTVYAKITRVTTTGAFAGTILAAGQYSGQQVTIMNASANAITFAASVTSNVADGASDIIAANTAANYTWDSTGLLWYRS